MIEWEEVTIEKICSAVVSGGTPLTSVKEYYLNGDIPWLKTKEVNQQRIYSTENKITRLGLENSSAKLIPPNSVTVAMYGDGHTAGRVGLTKIPLATNQACCNLIIDSEIADSEFVFYNLLGSYDELVAKKTGSGQQNLNAQLIKKFGLLLPPLQEQKSIAAVLSSLGDKIDLLHRQNQTLEAMAETLFRQWFIEETQDGWENKPLSFFGEKICGKTPSKKSSEFFDGDTPFIKIPDMHGNTFIFKTEDSLTEEGKNSQANKTLPEKSICVSCIATVGLVSMTTKASQTNQQINSIVPRYEFYRYFLYLTMKSSCDLLHALASGGTATLNLNTGNFSKIAVPFSGDKTIKQFNSVVDSIFEKIYANQNQIRNLETLRDTLLPKLMSGEVRVKLQE